MITIALLIMIDQITKYYASKLVATKVIIKGLLNFTYVQNRGAIFGIGQGSNYIMGGLAIVICIIVSMYIIKLIKSGKTPSIGYYMVISGGISNIIDRFVRGFVVDFIDTPFIATFNIADSLIVVGVIFIILSEIKEIMKDGK